MAMRTPDTGRRTWTRRSSPIVPRRVGTTCSGVRRIHSWPTVGPPRCRSRRASRRPCHRRRERRRQNLRAPCNDRRCNRRLRDTHCRSYRSEMHLARDQTMHTRRTCSPPAPRRLPQCSALGTDRAARSRHKRPATPPCPHTRCRPGRTAKDPRSARSTGSHLHTACQGNRIIPHWRHSPGRGA